MKTLPNPASNMLATPVRSGGRLRKVVIPTNTSMIQHIAILIAVNATCQPLLHASESHAVAGIQ